MWSYTCASLRTCLRQHVTSGRGFSGLRHIRRPPFKIRGVADLASRRAESAVFVHCNALGEPIGRPNLVPNRAPIGAKFDPWWGPGGPRKGPGTAPEGSQEDFGVVCGPGWVKLGVLSLLEPYQSPSGRLVGALRGPS